MDSDKVIIPVPIIENTVHNYITQISKTSVSIYFLLCLSIAGILISLYFVKVSISKHAPATIRPASEVTIIRSLVNGRVKESFIKENLLVRKKQVLYILESDIQKERQKLLIEKKENTNRLISDLNLVINGTKPNDLLTPLYRQSYLNYLQKINDATTRLSKVQIDYNRNFKLYMEKVIADAEFENFQFEYNKSKNDLELIKQNQLSQWQNELITYERELQELESQLAQLEKENENLIIKAPVTGTIQNVSSIYAGSMVFGNQDLAEISPDTSLIVEAYLSPNDIGLVLAGMPVRFQIDAFNYNQWGLATGKVLEISSDVHMINNKPVFKVRCLLDQNYLQLKNGYKGFLKKGMALKARFMITERTLWQLLYDKADDWLNPNTFTQ